ncbi:MBL fold metallo-hydrolase [Streptomyces sp. JNUCC 63]
MPVPLPNSSLRYVFVYVLETDRGPYLVDAGWNTDEAYNALANGLLGIGTRLEDVQGVLVTHVHPDHYGLAGRVREASGAWIALHPEDAALIPQYEERDPAPRLLSVMQRAGAPQEVMERQRAAFRAMQPHQALHRPDRLMEDGSVADIPGWTLSALWTPGHTPGHVCFWEPRHRLMLSGDHALPRITPNVPAPRGDDPLGDYLRSLDRLEDFDADEVLPAHEYRFTDLPGRLRELREHHDQRFAEVLAALSEGAETAWDIAVRMTWSRPWHALDDFALGAAVGEAFAHLRALARRGLVDEKPGNNWHWRIRTRHTTA